MSPCLAMGETLAREFAVVEMDMPRGFNLRRKYNTHD